MVPGKSVRVCAVVTAATLLLGASVARADLRFQFGSSQVITDGLKKPARQKPLWAAIEVPPNIDQSRPLDYRCLFGAHKADTDEVLGVKNVKAEWETAVYVLDHRDLSFQVFNFAAGLEKTDAGGMGFLDIPIPPEVTAAIFTDGFESGDVSAFIATYLKLKRGKKLNLAQLICQLLELPLSGVSATGSRK